MDTVFRGTALEVNIEPDISSAGRAAAALAAEIIRETPNAVLGLVADGALLPFYKELVRMYREEQLDFSGVTVFNLDGNTAEFATHPQSCARFMWQNFFRLININPSNVHIPEVPEDHISILRTGYEQKIAVAGGLDVQVLDIDSARQLAYGDAVPLFASREGNGAPSRTDGTSSRRMMADTDTVMDARICLVLASGAAAAPAVAAAVEGPLLSGTPSWILKQHSCAKIFMDETAAEELKLKEYYQWVLTGEPVQQMSQVA